MQFEDLTTRGADAQLRTEPDQLEVEVAIDSDRFSQSGPLGRRLAAMVAEACKGEAFQQAARDALELPKPFSVSVNAAIGDPIEEPQIEAPEKIHASGGYCPYPTYFSWSKGCSSWPW